MDKSKSIDEALGRWGFRSAWLSRSWRTDTDHIARWFRLRSLVEVGQDQILLFTRFLGWDSSQTPDWVTSRSFRRVTTECCEVAVPSPEELLSPDAVQAFARGHREARRLELSVKNWHADYDATAWKLSIPIIAYELWADSSSYARCLTVWNALSSDEREALCLPTLSPGHVGSTVALIPKIQSFFAGPHDVVICGDEEAARSLLVYSETHDGHLTLARASSRVVPERCPVESSPLPLSHARLHFRRANLESLGGQLPEVSAMVFQLPQTVHGLSGSDYTLGLLHDGNTVDICRTGLIRGIGNGYLTSEPWRTRVAPLGFSAPARIVYVPPNAAATDLAFSELRNLGTPGSYSIVDPWVGAEALEPMRDILTQARLLTHKRALGRGITPQWAREHDIQVRVLDDLHDRFIVGSRAAALIGASLNSLGKNHSFVVVVDAVMQDVINCVFAALWIKAAPLELP